MVKREENGMKAKKQQNVSKQKMSWQIVIEQPFLFCYPKIHFILEMFNVMRLPARLVPCNRAMHAFDLLHLNGAKLPSRGNSVDSFYDTVRICIRTALHDYTAHVFTGQNYPRYLFYIYMLVEFIVFFIIYSNELQHCRLLVLHDETNIINVIYEHYIYIFFFVACVVLSLL